MKLQPAVENGRIRTIDDAVKACRGSGLAGWALVAYAQQIVAHKMAYSRHNILPGPSHAFEVGAGYCQQQALALKLILDGLGIDARAVYATRCAFPPKVVEGIREPARISPHTWLKVRIGAEELDVCPGNTANTPGVIHFKVLSPVRPLWRWFQPISHWSSVLENLRRIRQARKRAQLSSAGGTGPGEAASGDARRETSRETGRETGVTSQ